MTENEMYKQELKRRISALKKFRAPAFQEERAMLEGYLSRLERD